MGREPIDAGVVADLERIACGDIHRDGVVARVDRRDPAVEHDTLECGIPQAAHAVFGDEILGAVGPQDDPVALEESGRRPLSAGDRGAHHGYDLRGVVHILRDLHGGTATPQCHPFQTGGTA